nr:cupin domain-containing protein [Kosakonia oryzae]
MSANTAVPFVIRNFNTIEMEHFVRPPLYESLGGSLTKGTAASKLGASIDTLPPGKRCCPFHLHHAQEEMFIVLNGRGTLRIGEEERAIEEGDVICVPPGRHGRIRLSTRPINRYAISRSAPWKARKFANTPTLINSSPGRASTGKKIFAGLIFAARAWITGKGKSKANAGGFTPAHDVTALLCIRLFPD